MSKGPITSRNFTQHFQSDDDRWEAVLSRNPAADGQFFTAVRTTGIYCRNVCSARHPLRKNIEFYPTQDAAEAAGFRACKRCRPRLLPVARQHADLVTQACRLIENSENSLPWVEIARSVNLSPAHFHRLFKSHTGVTPKAYAQQILAERTRGLLTADRSVTSAMYRSGYTSSSRFYESSSSQLGMQPKQYRAGGSGVQMHYAVGNCWLGKVVVAATSKGICCIMLGDDRETLVRTLKDRFPKAKIAAGDRGFNTTVESVVCFVNAPHIGLTLPLDIQGTLFQKRVWDALQKIPLGETKTYTQIAEQLGNPGAVRAVAGACAANKIAVAIPCHRVIRTDGSLAGYRWGVERKKQLLDREQETS